MVYAPDPATLGDWAGLPFFRQGYAAVQQRLAEETRPIFPPQEQTFAALRACPPEAVRVVILGQDPYHTPGKADGLAFSIPEGFGGRLDSLGNILKELQADLGTARQRTDLSDWAAQGVLLLNTVLTVPEGKARGHARIGWEPLVRDILAHLSDRPRAFVLWGKDARDRAPGLRAAGHHVIESAHPSPLSAYRGFFGSKPFSSVNAWLIHNQHDPIDWT